MGWILSWGTCLVAGLSLVSAGMRGNRSVLLSHINVFLPLSPPPPSKIYILSWRRGFKKKKRNYPDARSKKDGGCWLYESLRPHSSITCSQPVQFISVSNWLSTSRTQRASKFLPMSDDIRRVQLSLPALSAHSSPFRHPSPYQCLGPKHGKLVPAG